MTDLSELIERLSRVAYDLRTYEARGDDANDIERAITEFSRLQGEVTRLTSEADALAEDANIASEGGFKWIARAEKAEAALSRLQGEVTALRDALTDARKNGLIYWEPQTTRGVVARNAMMAHIDTLLSPEPSRQSEETK